MFAPLMGLMVLVAGLPPAEMAEVVAERLARLDKLVAEVEVKIYRCLKDTHPLDSSAWFPIPGEPDDGRSPDEPEEGSWRVLRIVRPTILGEGYVSVSPEPIVESFRPAYSVQRLRGRSFNGRIRFKVMDNPVLGYPHTICLPELFDLQIGNGKIPGLNTLRLLRDYPARLVRSDGRVSTYAVTVRSDLPGTFEDEHYEFDLNARGTPLRLRQVVESNRLGWKPEVYWEVELFTLATTEVNGAEMITEAVRASLQPDLPSYGIKHMVVHSVRVDETLSAQDVSLEPERRNSAILTVTLIPGVTFCDAGEEYDENGRLVASESDCPLIRFFIAPLSAVCGLVTAAGVAFASRPRRPHRA